jgi:predicted amidohydrolase YtcJ
VPSRLRLRRDDTRRMWTTAGAHLEHTEQRRGALLPGMLADFVVLDRDVMAVPDAALLSVNPCGNSSEGGPLFDADVNPRQRFGEASARLA